MLNEEITIKIIGKMSLEYPETDQLWVRSMVDNILNNYEITSRETGLIKTDIPERAMMYLAIKKLDGLSPHTLYNYRLQLQNFYKKVMKPVSMITTVDIRMYLVQRSADNNLKQTSIGTLISTLKSFFSWLVMEEIILKNPMSKIKTPKCPKRLREPLSLGELERLRDACTTLRQRAILEFLFSTGCRLSETTNVSLQDIDWEDLSLKVIGKGDKQRLVYLSEKARLYIKKYINSRHDKCEALFVSQKFPHGRLGNRSVEVEFDIIGAAAGFDKSIFPHLLRHTMATIAFRSGAAITSVQKILGHDSLATTQIYVDVSDLTVQTEYRKFLNQ